METCAVRFAQDMQFTPFKPELLGKIYVSGMKGLCRCHVACIPSGTTLQVWTFVLLLSLSGGWVFVSRGMHTTCSCSCVIKPLFPSVIPLSHNRIHACCRSTAQESQQHWTEGATRVPLRLRFNLHQKILQVLTGEKEDVLRHSFLLVSEAMQASRTVFVVFLMWLHWVVGAWCDTENNWCISHSRDTSSHPVIPHAASRSFARYSSNLDGVFRNPGGSGGASKTKASLEAARKSRNIDRTRTKQQEH